MPIYIPLHWTPRNRHKLQDFHKSVSRYLFPEPHILQQLYITEQSVVCEM